MNSTNIKNKNSRRDAGARLSYIAMRGEAIFHAGDLANLWGIVNKNTLHTTLSRYVASGLIHRIYKGLYAVKNIKEIDPFLLGVKAIHSLAYVSCETILYQNGVLNQPPHEITLVSRFSKHFSVADRHYRSRKMRNEFLFNDAGINAKDGVRIASLPRAVADMLYFNPHKHFDSGNSKLINWNKVKKVVDAIGYNIKIPKL